MRPYSRLEVQAWVESLLVREPETLSRVERARLSRLEAEFVRGARMQDAGARYDAPFLRLGEGDWGFATDVELASGGSRGEAWGRTRLEGALDFRSWATYETRYSVSLEPEAGRRTQENFLSSRERNWHGLSSNNDRAYLALERGPLRATLGREYAGWGPERGAELLVSEAASSLDALQVRLKLGRFRLGSAAALLSTSRNRRYSAHRLEVDLGPVRIGAQEAVVYTSPNLEPAYLFPLSFYYGNQFNERKDDNSLLGADLEWVSRWGVLQAELLVDDFIYDGDPAPQKLGFHGHLSRAVVLGGTDLDLGLGYTRIDRWVYTHRLATNAYVAGNGDPAAGDPFLGDPLGPDADRLRCEAAWSPGAIWTLWLRHTRTRRGDGNRDLSDWRRGMPYRLPFPSGAVVRELSTEVEARARLSPHAELRAGAALDSRPAGREARLRGEIRIDL